MKIYLAGSVSETEYRKEVIKNYNNDFNLFEPLSEVEENIMGYNPGDIIKRKILITDKIIKTIVEEDKKSILTCNVLVAYMNKYSCGTIMEVLFAFENGIPVYIINPNRELQNDIWLTYHCKKHFNSISDCFNHLKENKI